MQLYSVLTGYFKLDGGAMFGVVPKSIWQKAKSNGAWSLVSCVVAPAFSFDGFEMAKKGWEPKT